MNNNENRLNHVIRDITHLHDEQPFINLNMPCNRHKTITSEGIH